jgi:hypothetical protein
MRRFLFINNKIRFIVLFFGPLESARNNFFPNLHHKSSYMGRGKNVTQVTKGEKMKINRNFFMLLLISAVIFSGCSNDSNPESQGNPIYLEVGISPNLSKQERQKAGLIILPLIFEKLTPGSLMVVTNTTSLNTIARFILPDEKLSKRKKEKLFSSELTKLITFLNQAEEPEALDGNLNAPAFFRGFSEKARMFSTHEKIVVLMGSPIYRDYNNPIWSMFENYPSDAMLVKDTPYRTTENSLSNMSLHWIYLKEDFFCNEIQKEKLMRFWSLYAQRSGAYLYSWTGGDDLVWKRIGSKLEPIKYAFDTTDDKAVMLACRHTQPVSREIWTVVESSASEETATATIETPASTGQLSELGIRWTGNIDLDIFASDGHGTELSYKNATSAYATHMKDFLSAPTGSNGYETIVYNNPVRIERIKDIWINFYGGQTNDDGPEVELRARIDGKFYQKKVKIEATSGNSGGGNRETSKNWLKIPIMEMNVIL